MSSMAPVPSGAMARPGYASTRQQRIGVDQLDGGRHHTRRAPARYGLRRRGMSANVARMVTCAAAAA
jgi:hypothetical protein